jgi:hypothetical protein
VAVAAYYAVHLAGAWRWIFVGSAVTALYLNVFVLIGQSFTKLPFLKASAPTQSELPFVATQGAAGCRRTRRVGCPQLPPADGGADIDAGRTRRGAAAPTESALIVLASKAKP